MPDTSRAPSASRRRPAPAQPAGAYDARDAHELRRQILDAAHGLLVRRGYDRFSLREVARALGKSSGSPYRHFATKQELVWTLMEEALGSIYAAVRGAAERAGADPAARFEAMARAYVAYGLAHPTHYEIVFLLNPRGVPAPAVERLQGGRMTLEFVAGLLAEGARAGVLRAGTPDERPLVTAGVIWATLHGAVSIAIGNRLVPGQNLGTDELVEATIHSLLARHVVPAPERPAPAPAPAG